MNKTWLTCILIITFVFLGALKTLQVASLGTHFKGHKVIKLAQFEKAMSRVSEDEKPLLKLWESILTGRAAPLSKMMKEQYAGVGLNHIFTPSGFHLSAVLTPFLKFITHKPTQLLLIIALGILMLFLPGLVALKRMLLIKGFQHISGLHVGFILALVLDIFFGSFQQNALSFTYSFLFLGIIYSGVDGFALIVWFFIGQMIIAFFNGQDISLLLLVFSPILNVGFGLSMPILFLCSYPLNDLQLKFGLKALSYMQLAVDQTSTLILNFPTLEVSLLTMIGLGFFLFKKWKPLLIVMAIYSNDMNLDLQKRPAYTGGDFKPTGHHILKREFNGEIRLKFSDGTCRAKLVRGFWWETCSPRYKRSRNKKA